MFDSAYMAEVNLTDCHLGFNFRKKDEGMVMYKHMYIVLWLKIGAE